MRSPRNKTIVLTDIERNELSQWLLLGRHVSDKNCLNRTILGDCFEVLTRLPRQSVDLAILDPPYNLRKQFGGLTFRKLSVEAYTDYLRTLFKLLAPLLKPTASLYICGDYFSSTSIHLSAQEFFTVRNRITFERDKGRGAARNWKNASEDIWFCTMSKSDYIFNLEAVKTRRKVVAPYRTENGAPKDWHEGEVAYRDTCPSNLWTDITIPFWSMPENTDHPTQKPEKLIAKLILASSNPGDVVLSPFLGSGTDSVVAKKLGRQYVGIEINEEYALFAEKRLSQAKQGGNIQGYVNGVFLERNSVIPS